LARQSRIIDYWSFCSLLLLSDAPLHAPHAPSISRGRESTLIDPRQEQSLPSALPLMVSGHVGSNPNCCHHEDNHAEVHPVPMVWWSMLTPFHPPFPKVSHHESRPTRDPPCQSPPPARPWGLLRPLTTAPAARQATGVAGGSSRTTDPND
jgi:hypothetical protein